MDFLSPPVPEKAGEFLQKPLLPLTYLVRVRPVLARDLGYRLLPFDCATFALNDSTQNVRANQIVRLKPHIPLNTAEKAIEEIDEIIEESDEYR